MRAFPRLHVVSDDVVLAREDWLHSARTVLEAGGSSLALHLRGRSTPGALIYELAQQLLPEAARHGATLIVNDRVDVACAAGVHGVHLGKRSLSPKVVRTLVGADCTIGVSCHSEAEVAGAGRNGADYAFFGNVFATASHPERPPLGVAALQRVTTGLQGSAPGSDQIDQRLLPVAAIGGVGPQLVSEILDAGADGVAVLSGVWAAPDPGVAVSEYISALAKASATAGSMNDGGRSD